MNSFGETASPSFDFSLQYKFLSFRADFYFCVAVTVHLPVPSSSPTPVYAFLISNIISLKLA